MDDLHARPRADAVAFIATMACFALGAWLGPPAFANEAQGPMPPAPPQVPAVAVPSGPSAGKAAAPLPPAEGKPAGKPAAAPAAATSVPEQASGSAPAELPAADAGAAGAEPATTLPSSSERAPAPEPRSRRAARVPRKDPSPPSLTLEALRTEISNSPAEIEKNNLLAERERLGELVSALDVAQKQLRADTERLTAYLEDAKKQKQEKGGKDDGEGPDGNPRQPGAAPPGPSPIEVLSKAMRGMKPAQAAAIAERVPLSLAADVIQKMPARDAGKVMGLMEPARAAELAAEIASRDEARKKGAR